MPRPRLVERLNQGLQHGSKLTLISAPAGFGKTSLVGEWITFSARPCAWFAPDEGDNNPLRFLTYFVAALQAVDAVHVLRPGTKAGDFGAALLEWLQARQPPPIESILIALLNEMAAIQDDIIFVLDDYHLIDAQPVDDVLDFLLERLPPQVHLVITTREDPNLPLSRLRVRGQLAEIREADLRFTAAEAAEFLNESMSLNLAEEEIAALERRTEGWIAGLQMAALSLQGRADTTAFIQAFTGSHRFVMDYLVDEVLQRQPQEVHDFLLATSILSRLHAPLCDVVTGQDDSQKMLEALERGNLLLVPLDDQRQWYRYHQLFADVLQAHLLVEKPDDVSTLHSRASRWLAANNLLPEAIHHALDAGDLARTADLLEQAWPEMDRQFQSAAWLGWVQKLPEDLLRVRPVLSLDYAWAALNSGDLESAETYMRVCKSWLDTIEDANGRTDPAMIVVDEEQFRTLPAALATAQAYLAQARGNVSATITFAQRALELLPQTAHLQRGIVEAILGLAYWAEGDLEAAHNTLASGMADMQQAGNLLFAIRGTYILADIRLAQGRLREAIRTYEELLKRAAQQGEHVLRGTADLYLRLSELYLQQENMEAAADAVRRGQALGEQAATPIWRYRFLLAQARTKIALGDLDGALKLLDEAEHHYVRTPVPDLYPIGAMRARVWIAQSGPPANSAGVLQKAQEWAREQGLSAGDDLSYMREFEHITLAQLMIARYRHEGEKDLLESALALLKRLLQAAEAGGRMGSVIEILILQALAHEARGGTPQALHPLKRALTLAEPEGYMLLFIDEGEPMTQLLSVADAKGILTGYGQSLLDVFAAGKDEQPAAVGQIIAPQSQPLVEPLTPRELEILQLIAQGLSNRQISERLFLAMSTVKGHNSRIYGKLGVRRRTEAVSRARELGLL